MATLSNIARRSHKHGLEWVDSRGKYECDGCKMDGVGPGYRCNKCNFDLHDECARGAPEKTFQGFECKLYARPIPASNGCGDCSRNCDACGMSIKGFVYHCPDSGFDFHPQCTNLKSKIPIDYNGMKDVFTLQKNGPKKCKCCKKTDLKVKGYTRDISGWSYVSKGGCNFHVYCVMEMAMKKISNNTSSGSSSGLPLASKYQERRHDGFSGSMWLKFFEIFLNTVLTILIGNPALSIATGLAHIVTEVLFNVG